MNRTVMFLTFLSLCSPNTKSMELAPNSGIEDIIVANVACQMARCNTLREYPRSDLRNLPLVSKSWNAAMNKYAGLIIAILASKLQRYSPEVAKVAVAIELGTAGSRKWLVEHYKNEDECRELLFKLGQDFQTAILLIKPLQCINSTFKEAANKYTHELISQVCKLIKKSQLSENSSLILSSLAHVVVGTDEAMSQKFDREMIWGLLNCNDMSHSPKELLLRRIIAYHPHNFLNKPEPDGHYTWCWALNHLYPDYLKVLIQYSDHMECCGGCKCTLLEKLLSGNIYYCWGDLLAELLKNNIKTTGNELYEDKPLIVVALKFGEKNLTTTLVKKPSCDINVQSPEEYNRTPLMIAVRRNWCDIVELLLKRSDTNLDKKDSKGHTAYEFAVSLGHGEIAQKIQEAQEGKYPNELL